ncbi:MAG: hypothetical protein ACKVU2_08290 [Saprospiraceae bacterium]
MKNKHLLFLFLSVLALGLASRWLPLRYRTVFDSHLLRFDPEAVSRVAVSVPGKPDLILERIENGWSAEQDGRTTVAPTDTVLALLSTLAGINTFRLIKTGQPDTLGFLPESTLRVRLFREKKLMEHIEIGMEFVAPDGAVSTFLRLPAHQGVYLVNGQLSRAFRRSLDDFRSKTVFPLVPYAIEGIKVFGPESDSVFLRKNGNASQWSTADGSVGVPDTSVLAWLRLVHRLNKLPFADDFDESQEAETQVAALVLEGGGQSLQIRFFHVQPPDLPENLDQFRKAQRPSEYVIQSSTNPLNFFAISDTNLLRLVCRGPVLPSIRPNNR